FGVLDVGRLIENERGRIDLAYDPAWLATDAAFPISLSLPLTPALHVDGAGHAFFANLLPEGGAREAVCRRLGISIDNDFALLRAIGGDCAGALSVVAPESPHVATEARYERLDDRRLQSWISNDRIVPLL